MTRPRTSSSPSSVYATPANLTAALDYYRAGSSDGFDLMPPHPVLYLHGDHDGCIDVSFTTDAAAHLSPDSRVEVITHAGHFPHLEQPAAVNEQIVDWITA